MGASKLFGEAFDFESRIKPIFCQGTTVKADVFIGLLVLLFVTSVSGPGADFAMERIKVAVHSE